MSGLRFCFLTTFYPPFNFGGDGIGIQRFAKGLVRRGHHVTVVHDADAFNSLSGRRPPEPVEDDEGVRVVSLSAGAKPLGTLSNLLTQQTGRPVVHGARIQRLLAEGRFDVVNFHNISLVGGPGLLSYGGDAIRLYMAHEHWLVCPTHVLWRHKVERCDARDCTRCMVTYRRPPQLYRYNGYMARQLAHVDTFIAMSEFSRRKHAEFGFPHRMEVVPYFLPDPEESAEESAEARLPSPHPRPYFLFVGRLEKIKGLDDVIPIFRRFRDADLLIAGDGEHRAALERLAEGLDHVKFLGRVPFEDLRAYYENARALIVPSVCYETFGIILIEAFRFGIPVLARRLGPFPEIVETSGGGVLFEDEAELEAGLHRLGSEPLRRDEMAAAGHDAFRRVWVESAVVPRYLDVVRRTAARKGHARVLSRLGERVTSS